MHALSDNLVKIIFVDECLHGKQVQVQIEQIT